MTHSVPPPISQPTNQPNPIQQKKVRRAQQQPKYQPLEDDRRASGRRRSMALYAAVTAPAPLAVCKISMVMLFVALYVYKVDPSIHIYQPTHLTTTPHRSTYHTPTYRRGAWRRRPRWPLPARAAAGPRWAGRRTIWRRTTMTTWCVRVCVGVVCGCGEGSNRGGRDFMFVYLHRVPPQ
jgi:hypothetical protein